MRVGYQTPRIVRGSALRLAAWMAAALFGAGAAWAQSCPVAVAPGGTQNFSEASGGSSSGTNFSGPQASGAGASDNPTGNQMEAVAATVAGLASSNSASAQINYQFCVQAPYAGDTVPATISSQVYWNGFLSGASAGLSASNSLPSATVTMALVDVTTNGTVATTTPLSTQLGGLSFYNVISAGLTGVNGSQPAVLTANVFTGHVYQIQYNLDCEAPIPGVGVLNVCYFGSDVINPGRYFFSTPVCSGGCFSQVSSLSVTLGRDIFGEMETLRRSVAANNLTMEQEIAQLLGILNEIKALLSKPQPAADPPPASKHALPKGPIRPAPPRVVQQP